MSRRPYVLLSVATSVDGYIDDLTENRLLLSNAEDFDRVDEVRATCDAILIGANTIRRDNPSLLVRDKGRRADRVARGLPPNPVKVTITKTQLGSSLNFFNTGNDKIVYCPSSALHEIYADLGTVATVVDAGDPVDFAVLLDDLVERGIERLMIEGGETIHTEFLTRDLVDEIHLSIAPFFVGDINAPRFVKPGKFSQDLRNRMVLDEVRQLGDIAFIRYLTTVHA